MMGSKPRPHLGRPAEQAQREEGLEMEKLVPSGAEGQGQTQALGPKVGSLLNKVIQNHEDKM